MRVANAEERLIACLFAHNELAASLLEKLQPEKFVTGFNRRLYQSLLGKIINGETANAPGISDFSAECTPDEMGRVAAILRESSGTTAEDAERFVQIILSEGGLSDAEAIRASDPAQLQAQFEALRRQKK